MTRTSPSALGRDISGGTITRPPESGAPKLKEMGVSFRQSMLLSKVIGLRPHETPALPFKEPGAAKKMQIIETTTQILSG